MDSLFSKKKRVLTQAAIASTLLMVNSHAVAIQQVNGADVDLVAGGANAGNGGVDFLTDNTLKVHNANAVGTSIGFAGNSSVSTPFSGSGVVEFDTNANAGPGTGNIQANVGEFGALGDLRITGANGAETITLKGTINNINKTEVGSVAKSTLVLGTGAGGNLTGNIDLKNDSDVTVTDGFSVTGNIDNTAGVNDKGGVNFSGSSSVSGTIGATNGLRLINLTGGGNTTVNLKGPVFSDIIQVGAGTLDLDDNVILTTSGTNAFLGFSADGKVIIADGKDFDGEIDATGGANFGTVTFEGTSKVTDTVSNKLGVFTNPIKALTLSGGAGKTVTLENLEAKVQTTTIDDGTLVFGDSTGNSNRTLTSTVVFSGTGGLLKLGNAGVTVNSNVTGNITTTGNNVGSVETYKNSSIVGLMGANGNSLERLELKGGNANDVVTVSGASFIKNVIIDKGSLGLGANLTSQDVTFNADGKLSVGDGANLTIANGVVTTGFGTGNVEFIGDSTVASQLGTGANRLSTLDAQGAAGKTVTLQQDAFFVNGATISGTGTLDINANFTGPVAFTANGVLDVAANSAISAAISTNANSQGTVNFEGAYSTAAEVGLAAGNSLNAVNIGTKAAGTFTQNHGIHADTVTVFGANGAVLMPVGDQTIMGDLVLDANGASTLTLGTNTLTLAASGGGSAGDFTSNGTSIINTTLTGGVTPTIGNVMAAGTVTTAANDTVAVTPVGFIADGTVVDVLTGTVAGGVNATKVTGSTFTYALSSQVDATNKILQVVSNRPLAFPKVAENTQSAGVAFALESAGPAATGELLQLIGSLDALGAVGPHAMNEALETLATVVGPTRVTSEVWGQTLDAVTRRLDDLRDGGPFRVTQSGERGYSAGYTSNDRGAWIQVFGNDFDQQEREDISGYDGHTLGIAIGTDWEVGHEDRGLIGISGSYAQTDTTSKMKAGSSLDLKNIQGTLYGSYIWDNNWYVDAFIAGAYVEYDSKRNIQVPGTPRIFRTARAEYEGWVYGGQLTTGYVYTSGNCTVTPMATLRYSHVEIDDYTESDAGILNMSVSTDDIDSFKAGLGFRLQHRSVYSRAILTPEFRAMAFYDFNTDRHRTTSTMFAPVGPFTTIGPEPDELNYQLGIGLVVHTEDDTVFTISYDFEFREDYHAHNGYLKFRYEWA